MICGFLVITRFQGSHDEFSKFTLIGIKWTTMLIYKVVAREATKIEQSYPYFLRVVPY